MKRPVDDDDCYILARGDINIFFIPFPLRDLNRIIFYDSYRRELMYIVVVQCSRY